MTHIISTIEDEGNYATTDCKTRLQELVQKRSGQVLAYELLSESGPDHDKLFMSQVCLNGEPIRRGTGRTKKEAEQSAASRALEYLKK
jgi:ribonuclease-3